MKIRLSELRTVIREEVSHLIEMPFRGRGGGPGGRAKERFSRGGEARRAVGTIYLPTPTALALWKSEILGQMSDGMWENANPHEHWIFWNKMTPSLGAPKTEANMDPVKSSYNLAALLPIVGDRMVKAGRMAKAGGSPDIARHAEYMPETLEEFMRNKETGSWKYDFVKNYMEPVTPELAKKYYSTQYDMKDLKRDLLSIKAAMKNFEWKSANSPAPQSTLAKSPTETPVPQE